MAAVIRHKRGDTFDRERTIYWDAGDSVPADLTGWTAAMEIKHTSGVRNAVTVTIVDAPGGRVKMTADAAATATWPVGPNRADIEFTDGSGTVRSTETFMVEVEEDITNG